MSIRIGGSNSYKTASSATRDVFPLKLSVVKTSPILFLNEVTHNYCERVDDFHIDSDAIHIDFWSEGGWASLLRIMLHSK